VIAVVGGHSRNIGKTSAMCAILAATPEANWTAVKITQYGHGRCSDHGGECSCAPKHAIHPFSLDEQRRADGTDSGRYLAAGAKRSFWLRTRQGELAEALPALRSLIAESANTILESNSVLALLEPDLYVFVVDPRVADWKRSAQMQASRASALVRVSPGALPPHLARKPIFEGWDAPEFLAFVQQAARKRMVSVMRSPSPESSSSRP
jgi:molybdopterin-guanine dinucleotide biosynthesis protein